MWISSRVGHCAGSYPGLRPSCWAEILARWNRIDLSRSCARTELTATAPYAYAAVPPAGARLVFTAGACPLDESGAIVAPDDVAAQAERVMANLRTALQGGRGRPRRRAQDDGLRREPGRGTDLVAAWAVVHRHFGDHDAPSTLLGVSVLGYPDQLVEVEAVGALR